MNLSPLTKKDFLNILLLWFIAIFIFYPLFTAQYVFTDEIIHLWFNRQGNNMSIPNGRFLLEKITRWLFSQTETIGDITYIRTFSLVAWLVCIPLWYVAVKRVVEREKLPPVLAFFSVLYLVCTLQVCISVSWAAAYQLSLANTAGLLSGYYFYTALKEWNVNRKKAVYLGVLSLIAGQVTLFTYQSGMGCFLLPFLLHLIKEGKVNRNIVAGVLGYLLIYAVYYALFRLSLTMVQLGASSRTQIVINPFGKLKFLLLKAMPSSFHFNYVMNETDKSGKMLYRILFGAWIIINFIQQKKNTIVQRIAFPFIIVLVWALMYLPSMIVKENYPSNRTLFALNMAVFFLLMNTLINAIPNLKLRKVVVIGVCSIFVINAWYNFHKLFLEPVTKEYSWTRDYINENYKDDLKTVYFIRPEEDFFVRTFGITRSWDELGVPSSFFNWVPPFLVKQIVFEKTGDRKRADSLEVHHWLRSEQYSRSGLFPNSGALVVDVEKIVSDKTSVSKLK